jgi:hypothetical protein
MPADLDIGQVLIIAIAMIAAFVQWVWKLIQESKAARERVRPQQREHSSANVDPEVPQPPPMPIPGGGVWDLVETFKEEMRKAQAGLEPEKAPRPRPPIPERRRVVVPPPPSPPAPVSAPVSATAPKAAPAVPEIVLPKPIPAFAATATSKDDSVVLRMNLMNLDALKQAIILREILGPPKALQTPSDTY